MKFSTEVYPTEIAGTIADMRLVSKSKYVGWGVAMGVEVWPVHEMNGRIFLAKDTESTRKEFFTYAVYSVTDRYFHWLQSTNFSGPAVRLKPRNIFHEAITTAHRCVLFVEFKTHQDSLVGFLVDEINLYNPTSKRRAIGKKVDHKVMVESTSSSKRSTNVRQWEVLVYTDGSMSCNCPAWRFNKSTPRVCKHTQKVLADRLSKKEKP
jgi:hypothetical protein